MPKNPLTIKPVKLYKDCNFLGKLWRCRWYFAVPYWTIRELLDQRKKREEKDHYLPSTFSENWSLMTALAEYKMHKFEPYT